MMAKPGGHQPWPDPGILSGAYTSHQWVAAGGWLHPLSVLTTEVWCCLPLVLQYPEGYREDTLRSGDCGQVGIWC